MTIRGKVIYAEEICVTNCCYFLCGSKIKDGCPVL